MSWTRSYADIFARARELGKKVRKGSIVVLVDTDSGRWSSYQIEEVHVDRIDEKHILISNSYRCPNRDGHYTNFAFERPDRGWDGDDGDVYEINLYNAVGVYDSTEDAQPVMDQLADQVENFREATREARERFATFVRLIE